MIRNPKSIREVVAELSRTMGPPLATTYENGKMVATWSAIGDASEPGVVARDTGSRVIVQFH